MSINSSGKLTDKIRKERMETKSNKDNIHVYVRIRPLSSKEQVTSKSNCVRKSENEEGQIQLDSRPTPKTFNYDHVFNQDTSQQDIFQVVGQATANKFIEGYNCTIFAYGQTGAGKTYTMQGNSMDLACNGQESQHRGLQPRVFDYIFDKQRTELLKENGGTEFLVKCSHFEIYNEQIIDLLNPASGTLQLREDFKRGVFIEGITEQSATSSEEALKIMMRGARNRHVGATSMNIESSRSHSVFSLVLNSKRVKDGVVNMTSSKLHFVDLAGSERQKSTKASGQRLKEAGNINKSLTVLGSVINSLVEISKGKKMHVRYRDSKLTFLLKDSLGGNSKTSIIANVSPYSGSFGETLGTLKFAQRAKQIQNKALINEETSGCLENLKVEIKRLKKLLNKQKMGDSINSSPNHNGESFKQEVNNDAKNNSGQAETEEDWRKDPTLHKKKLIEQNKNQLELESLLKESMLIIDETEKRLQEEYAKKQQFMELFTKASNSYTNKENQMRLIIKMLNEKKSRLSKDQWGKDSEVQMLSQQVDSMKSMLEDAPHVMQVFADNLRLKHRLEYAEEAGEKLDNSFAKMQSILGQNQGLMGLLQQKLGDSISQRQEMDKKFERICLWSGMTSQQISDIQDQYQSQEFEKTIQTLTDQLLETRTLKDGLERSVKSEQKRFEQMRDCYEKVKAEYGTEVQHYEQRLAELKSNFEREAENNNTSSFEKVKLEDEMQALSLARDELLAKVDRKQAALTFEKQERLEMEDTLYDQLQNLNREKMQTEALLQRKNQQIEKGERDADNLKNEIGTLKEKLYFEVQKQAKLETERMEQENSLQEDSSLTKSRLSKEITNLHLEKDKLEQELQQLSSEKEALREELDTLQQSFDYLRDELASKQAENDQQSQQLAKRDEIIKGLQMTIQCRDDQVEDLQKKVMSHAKSNSPHNVAIKENYSLRNNVRDLKAETLSLQKQVKQGKEESNSLSKSIEGYEKREAYFKDSFKELSLENQNLMKKLSEVDESFRQKTLENAELNQTVMRQQEEAQKIREGLKVYQSTIQVNHKQFNDIKEKLLSREARYRKLQEEHKKSVNDYYQVSDARNAAQLRLISVKEELETLRTSSQREIGHLNQSLKTINEKNKQLIRTKFEKDEEVKALQEGHREQLMAGKKKVQEYKLLVEQVEREGLGKKQISELRSKALTNLEVAESEGEQLRGELVKVKLELNEKRKQCFQLYTRCDGMMTSFSGDLQSIKGNFSRLNRQFKVAHEGFQLKSKEVNKVKDENKLSRLELARLAEEKDGFLSEARKLKKQLLNGTAIIDKLSQENNMLRSEFDVLSKVHECYCDENPEVVDSALEDLREEVTRLTSQNKTLAKDLCTATVRANSQEATAAELTGQVAGGVSGELTVDMLTGALRSMEKEMSWVKTHRRTRSRKQLKSPSDLEKLVQRFTKNISELADREKTLKFKEYDYEAKMLRCQILEREIDLLKQGSMSAYNYCPDNFIPRSRGKAPMYVSSKTVPLGVSKETNRQRLTNLEKSGGEDLLGVKRHRPSSGVLVARDPNSSLLETPFKKNLLEEAKHVYSGLKENNFDPNNYDYNAATPKKRLKL